MPHPEVLVEMDLTKNIRWYTVRGRHYYFSGAQKPLTISEEAPPDHPYWATLLDAPDAYNRAREAGQLVPAYPKVTESCPASLVPESRPGLCHESIDWDAHRAFLRSL